MRKVSVLGTEYTLIEDNDTNNQRLAAAGDGYCDTSIKECVVDEMIATTPTAKADLQSYKKSVIRHELIHAFLYESGLDACSWAKEEEMVDWLAIQSPKLMQVFVEVGAL